MNFKVILLLLILCFFQRFDGITCTSDVQEQALSKKHSFSIGNLFRSIGKHWKKAKKKSAERKFLEQIHRWNKLEEAARIKAERLRKFYENSSKTTFSDLVVPEKGTLKKAYHYRLWRFARHAEKKLKKCKKTLISYASQLLHQGKHDQKLKDIIKMKIR